MNRRVLWIALAVSILWWAFPDIFPGPIDDLIAGVVTVASGISLAATKAKAAQDAVALLTSDATPESR